MICGVGINDADYTVTTTVNGRIVWKCPFYSIWVAIIRRSYDKKFHDRQPTYKNCTVCDEWHSFMSFKKWMESQDWIGLEIDKDIIVKGNKVYSPETCVFVDTETNKILIDSGRSRGKHLVGACWDKSVKKFQSSVRDGEAGKKFLGFFDNEIKAHHEYLKFKIKRIEKVAKKQIDIRVKKGLLVVSEEMNKSLINGVAYEQIQ